MRDKHRDAPSRKIREPRLHTLQPSSRQITESVTLTVTAPVTRFGERDTMRDTHRDMPCDNTSHEHSNPDTPSTCTNRDTRRDMHRDNTRDTPRTHVFFSSLILYKTQDLFLHALLAKIPLKILSYSERSMPSSLIRGRQGSLALTLAGAIGGRPRRATTTSCGRGPFLGSHNCRLAADRPVDGIYGILQCNIRVIMRRWRPLLARAMGSKIPHFGIELTLLPPSTSRWWWVGLGVTSLKRRGLESAFSNWRVGCLVRSLIGCGRSLIRGPAAGVGSPGVAA